MSKIIRKDSKQVPYMSVPHREARWGIETITQFDDGTIRRELHDEGGTLISSYEEKENQ